MFDSLSGAEILTIAVIALVVFGPNRLPDLARSIGRYVRELRQAVTDLRRGIEQEVGPIREPIKEIRQELSQPAADVRRTFRETAETARAAEREIRQAAKNPPPTPGADGAAAADGAGKEAGGAAPAPEPDAAEGAGADSPADDASGGGQAPGARWIAPDPPVGVPPSESRRGMGDPMPAVVHPPPAAAPAAGGEASRDAAPDEETADTRPAGETDGAGADGRAAES